MIQAALAHIPQVLQSFRRSGTRLVAQCKFWYHSYPVPMFQSSIAPSKLAWLGLTNTTESKEQSITGRNSVQMTALKRQVTQTQKQSVSNSYSILPWSARYWWKEYTMLQGIPWPPFHKVTTFKNIRCDWLSNIQKETQRGRHKEETEKCIPNEIQGKVMARDQRETNISNILHREFKKNNHKDTHWIWWKSEIHEWGP